MPDGTVARQTGQTQTTYPAPKARGAGKQSPQRILQERLTSGQFKPRAWAVAMVLEAYMRQDAEGRRFATVYHPIIAEKAILSVQNVRRALRELTSGDFPLYERRGTSGQKRKVRARNGWELDTAGVCYYWIENLESYLAARDTARAVNVLAFEQRKGEHHAERLQLQAALFKNELDQATYEARIAQLDAKARGRLPKRATARKATTRCLTPQQMVRFADLLVKGGATDYGALLSAAGEKGVREFHALHRHVFGNGEGGGCSTCEAALFDVVRQHRTVAAVLELERAEAARCGCGAFVVRSSSAGAAMFWRWAQSEQPEAHECIHEQNRLMKLRRGGAHP